jgi:hypothetical protein
MFTLEIDTGGSLKTLIAFYQTAQSHIPEKNNYYQNFLEIWGLF